MPDEEAVRAIWQSTDELIFLCGEPEAVDIILGPRLGVDHEDLRCRLLDDGAGDFAFERILRALRGKADNAIPFANSLFPILDPANEHLVVERLPALIDHDDRRRAVEPFFDPVEKV